VDVVIVGSAGNVGEIIVPTLEKVAVCSWFDGDRWWNDEKLIENEVKGKDAVVYIPKGAGQPIERASTDIDETFDVNVKGWYRWLRIGLKAGVRRFVYASSMSVYQMPRTQHTDEQTLTDDFRPYAMSKMLAELVAKAAARQYMEAVIVCLRLYQPKTIEEWGYHAVELRRDRLDQGPWDTQQLFLKALECDMPGCHVMNATGDAEGLISIKKARDVLGWTPEGR